MLYIFKAEIVRFANVKNNNKVAASPQHPTNKFYVTVAYVICYDTHRFCS